MDAENNATLSSSEKTDQIVAEHDTAPVPAQTILDGAESAEIVYLHGIRFVMLAALFVLQSIPLRRYCLGLHKSLSD